MFHKQNKKDLKRYLISKRPFWVKVKLSSDKKGKANDENVCDGQKWEKCTSTLSK